MYPSMRSENTNAVTTRTPTNNCPRGKKPKAPATTPTVPTIVTVSGETPHFINTCEMGLKRLVQKWRKRSSIDEVAPS